MCNKRISTRATHCLSCANKGANNPSYKEGIPKKYTTVHYRIKMLYGKADRCENPFCEGKSKRYDWSNKDHKYDSLDREKWKMLCKICHSDYDNQNL